MRTSFYLYFPARSSAQDVGRQLAAEGFDTQVRLGADDVNWLVLATRQLEEDDLYDLEDRLTDLAESYGGELDGFERSLRD